MSRSIQTRPYWIYGPSIEHHGHRPIILPPMNTLRMNTPLDLTGRLPRLLALVIFGGPAAAVTAIVTAFASTVHIHNHRGVFLGRGGMVGFPILLATGVDGTDGRLVLRGRGRGLSTTIALRDERNFRKRLVNIIETKIQYSTLLERRAFRDTSKYA